MNEHEILTFLSSITDDQAENSDIGGDSDADDNFNVIINSTGKSETRNSSSCSNFTTPLLTPTSTTSNSPNLPDFQLPSASFDKTLKNLPLRSVRAKNHSIFMI